MKPTSQFVFQGENENYDISLNYGTLSTHMLYLLKM